MVPIIGVTVVVTGPAVIEQFVLGFLVMSEGVRRRSVGTLVMTGWSLATKRLTAMTTTNKIQR